MKWQRSEGGASAGLGAWVVIEEEEEGGVEGCARTVRIIIRDLMSC